MKTKSIFSGTKLRVVSFLLLVAFLATPEEAKASGWTQVSGQAAYCNGTAYTINTEEFQLFEITWATRTVYRNGMGEPIADPCANGGGNQP